MAQIEIMSVYIFTVNITIKLKQSMPEDSFVVSKGSAVKYMSLHVYVNEYHKLLTLSIHYLFNCTTAFKCEISYSIIALAYFSGE